VCKGLNLIDYVKAKIQSLSEDIKFISENLTFSALAYSIAFGVPLYFLLEFLMRWLKIKYLPMWYVTLVAIGASLLFGTMLDQLRKGYRYEMMGHDYFDGKKIIFQDITTYYQNFWGLSGNLIITSTQLVFHARNMLDEQNDYFTFLFSDLYPKRPAYLVWYLPNAFRIIKKDGTTALFVTSRRSDFIKHIRQLTTSSLA
jgi:hypothetical protein